MEKSRFVCSRCGADYMLQAWKAVCPNCKSEFSLEKVPEKHAPAKVGPSQYASFLILGYTLFSIIFSDHPTIINLTASFTPVPSAIVYALFVVKALLVFVGAEPALWVSTLTGVGAVISGVVGLQAMDPLSYVSILLGAAWAIVSLLTAARVRRRRAESPSELREFSGWAGD